MRITLFLILVLVVFGCKDQNTNPVTQEEPSTSLSGIPDFDKFYYRFHADSAFQLAHVSFPLEGMPSHYGDKEIDIETYRWQKEDWTHHNLITSKEFESSFQVLDETLITEFIIHEKGTMGMKRRFSKSDDGWFLIYYAGMNPIKIN